MILKTALLIFFPLITFTSLAQTPKFGIKGGANFAGFHTGKSANTDIIGFHFGGISEFELKHFISLQAEVLYSKKGGLIHLPQENQSIQLDSKLDYIDLPILIKYYIFNNFSLDFGPQIGFLFNNKEQLFNEDEDVEFRKTKFVDFSLTGGIAYRFNNHYFIQTRYNYGLSEIFRNERYKNSLISLSLGYFFN